LEHNRTQQGATSLLPWVRRAFCFILVGSFFVQRGAFGGIFLNGTAVAASEAFKSASSGDYAQTLVGVSCGWARSEPSWFRNEYFRTVFMLRFNAPTECLARGALGLSHNPHSRRLDHFIAGESWWRIGDRDEAVLEWRKAQATSYLLGLATSMEKRYRLQEALEFTEAANEVSADNPEVIQRMAELQSALGRYADASESFAHLSDLLTHSSPAEALFFAGRSQILAGDLLSGLDLFQTAVRVDPGKAEYAIAAADAALKLGLLDKARHWLKTAIQLPGLAMWTLIEVGDAYASLGDSDAAAQAYRQAGRESPGSPYPATRLARLALSHGDGAGALEALRPFATSSETPDISYYLGEAYFVLQDYQSAVACFARAAAMAPDLPGYRARLEEVCSQTGERYCASTSSGSRRTTNGPAQGSLPTSGICSTE